MKLTKEILYSLIILVELAELKEGEYMSLKKLIEGQKLPLKFMEFISSSLSRADIITSKKGLYGGYRLNKTTSEINLKTITNAVKNISINRLPDHSTTNKAINYALDNFRYLCDIDMHIITLDHILMIKNKIMKNEPVTSLKPLKDE